MNLCNSWIHPRRRFSIFAGLAVGLVLPRLAPAAPTGNAPLDAALAERLALIAEDASTSDEAPEAALRQAAALLDLARESNPKEIRFARSSANILLRLGEADRALAALGAVRALDPKDQLAQIQYIDLAANRLESADAHEAYLQQVVDANGVAPEVRSHAALSLMNLLYQRSEDQRAGELLEKALALNPQNISALTTKYRMAVAGGDTLERVKSLAELVRVAPTDAATLARVARECIAAADYAGAHSFYEFDFTVSINRGQTPPVDDLIDLAGSELLSGTAADIGPLIKQALTGIKDDGRLYAIDLLASQFADAKPEDLAPAIATARGVYLAQIAGVSQLLNQPELKEMPTTNPAVPMPDVTRDAAKLAAGDPSQLRTAYTVALAEQLWFDLYFRAAPVDDTSIAALATLLGSDADPLVVRMQGWKLLSAGQSEEATVKLSAVADRDGYAKLGLAAAQLALNKPDESKATLNDLITARPSGMLAVYLSIAAKAAGLKAEPTAQELEIARIFSDLKRPVGDMIKNSRGSYLLTAQPVNLSFGPGEPLLARVTIQNNSRVPITIGPGGYIEPRFVIDLSIRGDTPRGFPGVAAGKWAGAVRLIPQQSVSQVIRIDRGQAYAFFRTFPTPPMTVTALVTTNAVVTPKGAFPSCGGQQTTIGSVMERKSSPLFVEEFRAKVFDKISNGSPVERMNNMDLAAAVIPLLESQASNAEAKRAADQLRAALDTQLAKEPVEEVKAWCTVSRMVSTGDSKDAESIMGMKSPAARAALLVLARAMPAEPRKKIAQAILDTGAEGPIVELARGVLEQPEPPAPTTEPATP
jgi:tetratricopeptide (TPR) repeat protein